MTLTKKQIIALGFVLFLFWIISILAIISLSQKKQELRSSASEPVSIPTPTSLPANDFCESASISAKILSPGGLLTISSRAKRPNIKYFVYAFSNKDNKSKGTNPIPLFIKFSPDKHFVISHISNSSATDSLDISFDDIDKPDLNWAGKKPKHIQVNVYLVDNQGIGSGTNSNCEVSFDVGLN